MNDYDDYDRPGGKYGYPTGPSYETRLRRKCSGCGRVRLTTREPGVGRLCNDCLAEAYTRRST